MDRYNSLGRHTPPPPPYSLSKRDPVKTPAASQPSADPPPPPPPPPYLTSTQRCDCMNPAISNLAPQRISPETLSSCTCNHSNPTLLGPLAVEQPARHLVSNEPRKILGDNDYKWRSTSTLALPIEPKWTPALITGFPGSVSGGRATVYQLPITLERLGQTALRERFLGADTVLGHDPPTAASTLSKSLPIGHSYADPVIQTPIHLPIPGATTDAKLIRPFRKQSSKDIASLANILTATLPGSIRPPNCPSPLSAMPSMLVPVPKVEASDTPEDILEVQNALHRISDSGSTPMSASSPEDHPAHFTSMSKTQDPACAAPSLPDTGLLSRDPATTSPGQDRTDRHSLAMIKRLLSSSRYEPYRRPAGHAESVEREVASGIEEGCEKVVGVETESTSDEEADEGEREGKQVEVSME